MKKIALISALCATSLFGATTVFAGDSANIAVSATIVGTCQFNAPKTGAISFVLDQTSTGDVVGTVGSSPTFWCTKGTTYSVTGNDGANSLAVGARRMKHATLAEFIPYSFLGTTKAGTGLGKTAGITLTLTSPLVANADFINVPAGTYNDTVVVSITP